MAKIKSEKKIVRFFQNLGKAFSGKPRNMAGEAMQIDDGSIVLLWLDHYAAEG